MSGLSDASLSFINKSMNRSYCDIVVAGKNFGCVSERENTPISLGVSGLKALIEESFARIFFRNCISTGEILLVQVSK